MLKDSYAIVRDTKLTALYSPLDLYDTAGGAWHLTSSWDGGDLTESSTFQSCPPRTGLIDALATHAWAPVYDFIIDPPKQVNLAWFYTGMADNGDNHVLIRIYMTGGPGNSASTWYDLNAFIKHPIGQLICPLDFNYVKPSERDLTVEIIKFISLNSTSNSQVTVKVQMTYYSTGRDTSWYVKKGSGPTAP